MGMEQKGVLACFLPRQCHLLVRILGCVEWPKDQAHRRSVGASGSYPHMENSVCFDMVFRLIALRKQNFFSSFFFALHFGTKKLKCWDLLSYRDFKSLVFVLHTNKR